ncbi:MAG TPA: hypothetical protein VL172_09905, partial [Kofleriaceae bacterium]|nr:hypothetical protein [Kofleriaceae bacterium]
VESVAGYARALRDAGRADAAVAMLEVAEALGYRMTDKDRKFLDEHPVRRLAADEGYRGHVDHIDRAALIRDRDDQPMAELLGALWEAAALLWSEPEDALERCGVIGARRVGGGTTLRAASMFPRVAAALEIGATFLYATDTPDAPDVRVVCVSTPIVVLGPRMTGIEEGIGEGDMRFLLGRAAELARPERVIAVGLPRDDLDSLLGSLWRVFGAGSAPPDDAARHHDEILRTTLPVKLRSRMTELLKQLARSQLDADRFLDACQRSADRAGLLAAGDLGTAVRLAGSTSRDGRRQTRHLIECALSPRYLPVRARLGVGAVK